MPTVATISTESDRCPNQNLSSRFCRHANLWIWSAVLLLVNLPLVWGQVRTGMLFLPEAVMSGQWWRVITYPLVHLSWYHLLLDAGGFLLLYTCLEERRKITRALYIASASAGSLLLSLATAPAISQNGLSGLSGIAHGLMAISAMEMLRLKDQRWWGAISLATVVSKSAYELWSGKVFFDFMHMGLCGQPLAASHAGGVLGGLVAFILLSHPGRHEHVRQKTPGNCKSLSVKAPSLPLTQKMLWQMVRLLAHTMYRIRCQSLNRIPVCGPAVLVCNHVSYVDWLIIASACRRPVRFVMHQSYYRLPLLRRLFRMARAIPIDSGRKHPAVLFSAFKQIDAALRAGSLVCLFPEGRLTRTGRIEGFRPGIERIVRRYPVPVIPLALRGLWGSFFSHKYGPPMRHWPRSVGGRVELTVGRGIPPLRVTAQRLHLAVMNLHGQSPQP